MAALELICLREDVVFRAGWARLGFNATAVMTNPRTIRIKLRTAASPALIHVKRADAGQ
jgi:hypothetical protein